MNITSEEDLKQLIKEDPWMMEVLETAMLLELPDWWVCAGFVRSKVWDILHDFEERTPLPDVDVIYFDKHNVHEEEEKRLEQKLRSLNPTIPWSVKNQARMHVINHLAPYTSSVDAISKFPETATALGVSLNVEKGLILTAPHGIEDVVNMVLRPTPHFIENKNLTPIYEERLLKKDWKAIWSRLLVYSAG
ncbi:nucleotidyltransferase family protein [Paenibacillus wynnii]|uniref:nucleotidyltransferase family protein n=1 Tax=Paenibacillus wynnii TaxID=268407 RepID=UPI0027921DC2|nr:nucleotidyltransferase family protein [Paenibacillus wynnii]MDQ0196564.1 hypothetical protein [Paenibacillus wynnii]